MEHVLFLGLGGAELVILLIIGLLPMILAIYCLIDILKSNFKDGLTKALWIIIILLVPLVGSILYLLLGRSQKVLI